MRDRAGWRPRPACAGEVGVAGDAVSFGLRREGKVTKSPGIPKLFRDARHGVPVEAIASRQTKTLLASCAHAEL